MTEYRSKVIWRLVLVMLTATWFATPAAKDGVEVYPRFGSSAPATVKVTTRIEPMTVNVRACVGYDGPAQGRESCFELDGDKERRTVEHWFRDLPGGRYVAYLAVFRKGQERPQVWTAPFCIQGSVAEGAVECSEPSL